MTTYESMLAAYKQNKPEISSINAEQEVCQKIVLAGLHRGGFFNHAAFYGGTCLRLFHGLPRFSEDMDFSLTEKRDDIHLENYFNAIREEFSLAGFEVDITKKDKKIFGRVESAFLKENTEAYDIKFQTKKKVKVKLELDIDPPLGFQTEQKLLVQPYSFMTRCYALPDLYAGSSPSWMSLLISDGDVISIPAASSGVTTNSSMVPLSCRAPTEARANESSQMIKKEVNEP